MADTREKLIELLGADTCKHDCCKDCEYGENRDACIGFLKEGMADHLIANGVTIQKWIPVAERLPERTDGHVLVTDGDVAKISCRNAMYQTRGGETRCAQNYGAGMCVTHWMPLPEPPKGE